MAKSKPVAPEFGSVTVSRTRRAESQGVPPFDPVRALAVLMTCTTWPLVPLTLYDGTEVTSVPQVSSPPPRVVQSRTFASLRVTVRVPVTPAAGIDDHTEIENARRRKAQRLHDTSARRGGRGGADRRSSGRRSDDGRSRNGRGQARHTKEFRHCDIPTCSKP